MITFKKSDNHTTMPTTQTAKGKPVEHYASRLRARNQITIPRLTPHTLTPQPWSDEQWRQAEATVDAEIKAGQLYGPYLGAKELIAALRKDIKSLKRGHR